MPAPHPTASARISTGRTFSKAAWRKPAVSDSGWLNRALAGLAPGGRVDLHGTKAFAVGPVTPLVVRGPAPVLSWSPQRVQPASVDTVQRLLDLYRHSDVRLAAAIDESTRLASIQHSGRHDAEAGWPRSGASARLFCRGRRHRGEIFEASRRTAGRRTGALRLRYALQRGHCTTAASRNCSARSTAHLPRSIRKWGRHGMRR